MKNLTRKLFLSVAVLAVAIVAMSTSTFAWFTMSGSATVNTVTTSVDGGSGFLISSDSAVFSDELTLSTVYAGSEAVSQLNYNTGVPTNGTTITDNVFLPVTSTGTPVAGGQTFVDLAGNDAGSSNSGYLDFTIWFTASADDTNVYLLASDSFLSASTVDFAPLSSFDHNFDNAGAAGLTTYAPGGTIAVNPANAFRMSMIGSNQINTGTEESPVMSDATVQILSDDQLSSAVNTIDRGGKFTSSDAAEDFASVAYYDAVMFNDLDSTGVSEYTYMTTKSTVASADDITPIITLSASNDNAQYVVFRVWLEGWDGDAFDAVRSSDINLDIEFTSDYTLAAKFA